MTARTRSTIERWSAKKKAQVLTVGTMIFLVVMILLLPHAFAYRDPMELMVENVYTTYSW